MKHPSNAPLSRRGIGETMTEPEILYRREGAIARLTLNRPKALNALTLDMIRSLTRQLRAAAADDSVGAVVVEGVGGRAYCAGGDIRALYDDLVAGGSFHETFWREEYALNALIARYRKPYVAVMHGIVMGGGVGVSAHASTRVVTEATRFAMPEVGLGFIPDVGASWLLSRAPGELGTFLALTGDSIGGADALAARLADVSVPSEELTPLLERLARLRAGPDAAAEIGHALASCARDAGRSPLAEHRAAIDQAFGHDTVEAIVAAANASSDPFVAAATRRIATRSPLALKVTLAMLRRARSLPTLEDCLALEFRIGDRLATAGDFQEGIRAVVVDKDGKARWNPPTLAEVGEGDVERYFEPLDKPELWGNA